MKEDLKAILERNNADYSRAVVRKDRKVFERLLAKDGVFVDTLGGINTRDQWIGIIMDPTFQARSTQAKILSVKEFGDTAVMVETFSWTGSFRGKRGTFHERGTVFLQRRDGAWVAVAIHTTEDPKKKK